ncbi:uncharacterized protein [Prorops nasuta]|uniref:uncharacterized protein n=1 Tax=Prorops nasuta TaxID=863751 RepID=UPI0034CD13EB
MYRSDSITNDKENNNPAANEGVDIHQDACFANAFTLPVDYLPTKKKAKLKASGKRKLPAAGTADEWWNYNMEKERQKKEKEEKLIQKKKLQQQKKELAEEKKVLAQKMKEIAEKIKKETK